MRGWAAPLPRPGRAGTRRPPPAPVPSPPAEHAHGPEQQGGGRGRPAVGAERQRVGAHAGGARLGGCWCLAAAAGEESFGRPPAPGSRGAQPASPPRPPRTQGAGFGCSERDLASGPGATQRAPPRGAPGAGGSRPPAPAASRRRRRGSPGLRLAGKRLPCGGKGPGRRPGNDGGNLSAPRSSIPFSSHGTLGGSRWPADVASGGGVAVPCPSANGARLAQVAALATL